MTKKSHRPTTPARARTTPQQATVEGQEPRLPHERDESADSHHDEPRGVIRQAADDIESGKQDTDRGPEMNKTYQRQKRGG